MNSGHCRAVWLLCLSLALMFANASWAEGDPSAIPCEKPPQRAPTAKQRDRQPQDIHLYCGTSNTTQSINTPTQETINHGSCERDCLLPIWIDALLKFVGFFAWPIVTLLIAFLFKVELVALLANIESIQINGSKVSFRNKKIFDILLMPIRPKVGASRAISENLAQTNIEGASQPTALSPTETKETVGQRCLLAEDLVLRVLQAENACPIKRQVTAGPGLEFDGVFLSDGWLNIVEVKYFGKGEIANRLNKLNEQLDRLASSIQGRGWENVRIVLVIVFEQIGSLEANSKSLSDMAASSSIPITLRYFSMTDLLQRFA